jgi:hypothetical protein
MNGGTVNKVSTGPSRKSHGVGAAGMETWILVGVPCPAEMFPEPWAPH